MPATDKLHAIDLTPLTPRELRLLADDDACQWLQPQVVEKARAAAQRLAARPRAISAIA